MAYYSCQASGIMTDARAAAYVTAQGWTGFNFWVKVPQKRRWYVISDSSMSRRDARNTLKQPNGATSTGNWDEDFYTVT